MTERSDEIATRLAETRTRIEAAWSLSEDDGETWAHDFDLVYTRTAD